MIIFDIILNIFINVGINMKKQDKLKLTIMAFLLIGLGSFLYAVDAVELFS